MDVVQTRDFLLALFDPQDLIEVRLLPSGKQFWCNGPDEVCAPDFLDEYVRDLNLAGDDVYFGGNPRRVTGGRAKDVALARCLFVDIDGVDLAEAERRVTAAGLPDPTAIVLSGGGAHLWWRLDEPIADLPLWTATQKSLIAAMKSDHRIHDPPRVMRLPGTRNHRRDAPCVAAELSGKRASLADFPPPSAVMRAMDGASPGSPSFSAAPYDGPPLAPALTRNTLSFISGTVPEGERNARLFVAAADLKACGMESLRPALVDAAARHGLGPREIERTIESAFSKERFPAKMVPVDEPRPTLAGKKPENTPAVRLAAGMRGKVLSNHVIGESRQEEGEKARRAMYARSYADIYNDAQNFTGAESGGGVRRIGGALFARGEETPEGYCPNGNSIHWLGNPNALFSWLGNHVDLKWRKDAFDHVQGGAFTLPTKGEMFAFFAQAAPDYYGIELLPHEPRMRGIYYAGSGRSRPDGWVPPKGQGKLWELIERLNYATAIDKTLLKAMFLTPGWGGPPGARPAFVIDSPGFGQGTGKTTTADLLCDIWGLALTIGHEETMEDLQKRLLSIGAVGKRVALLDNVRGRKDSAGLESIVTAREITGHRLYIGNMSRPNLLTYVVTANVPRLSKDLADRSVIIHVGKARHADAGFMEWARAFIEEHRATIIGDAVEALAGDPVCLIPPEGRDRWGAWQDGVLARVEGGDRAAVEARIRRKVADVDTEDAEDIAEAIRSFIRANINTLADPDTIGVRFAPAVMLQVLVDAGLVSRDMGTKGLSTMLVGMAGVGPCAPLAKPPQTNAGRFYTWGRPPEGSEWTTAYVPAKERTWLSRG